MRLSNQCTSELEQTPSELRILLNVHQNITNSQEFVNFCEMNGIKRQLTAAYSPHQNGVLERKNCIIMNMVRNMLALKKVPKRFWPEAVNWSNHILKRCPTLTVKNVTPKEAWSGKKT